MSNKNFISDLIAKQRFFFGEGKTLTLQSRKKRLETLSHSIRQHEREILEALASDLGKSPEEALLTEIREVRKEIEFTLKHLSSWMKSRSVPTPLTLFGSKSRIQPQPLGTVLIIAPWNYPFNLSLMPLIPALAAGNTVILKPSEMAPATSAILAKIISDAFLPEEVALVEGGVPETTELLSHAFDHIFFTGGEAVGRIVMEAASRHLTPVTLELGGKSPALVAADAHVELAAKRIVWGKFMNAGQTCVAPDYVLVEEGILPRFIKALKKYLAAFYGDYPAQSPFYGRIINERHFDRLVGLLENQNVLVGGNHERKERFLAPTVLGNVSAESPVMQEEIFGPILPLVSVSDMESAIRFVQNRPRPLALYVFSEDRIFCEKVLRETTSGGACVNDTLVHLSSHHLPFGGVGPSGMGAYHGKEGFRTFSHYKSIVQTRTGLDLPLRYPPYPRWFRNLMGRI
ncbi:aldehyde dehydrogenase (NAD+) [Desulfobotulus alkaliphilus]|uniref:Aldehyde dehydrogenase n=1 Tax=Desulfobotulus alkaliphilus TaxID=622671 RepID=A0A562S0N6_9BACT|nr:aldehyde dehydrogenase [Desulfobotulus alkaliphilus]TWI74166.1 aldehyde dehydrogenase (NAD+) [Desulfobotulus alkaliphilus]